MLRLGKKFWKMKIFPAQGKVLDFVFSQVSLDTMKKKSHGKVSEFQNFPQKVAS